MPTVTKFMPAKCPDNSHLPFDLDFKMFEKLFKASIKAAQTKKEAQHSGMKWSIEISRIRKIEIILCGQKNCTSVFEKASCSLCKTCVDGNFLVKMSLKLMMRGLSYN